jgi:Reverse transcriptase (RNA-dependent DNA polymerase)
MLQLLECHCKGVVIDIPACEKCSSLFGGESAFDYTPESEICFERSSFNLSNGDPNVEQHIVTHNLRAWNARTMKKDLVNFETRFKHRLFLEDDDSVPEDWKRSKFKELVTSEYGEKMAGYNQHQGFADVLRAMGFIPSKAKADICMREINNLYEYIAVYADDLLITARNAREIVQTLEEQHKFKLKGVGPLTFHLGCDDICDQYGTLCFGPRKYITKMMDQFKNMFGCKPRDFTSPLEKGDHPAIYTSEELDVNRIKRYRTMIGCLQWAVSLGRFDTQTAIMTMSRFRVVPRKGHLERLKRICGYLKKFSSTAIRVRTSQPHPDDLPNQEIDWCHTAYGKVEVLLPRDAPKPLGKMVTTVTYMDANLYHDMLNGRSMTGVLHLCNGTLVDGKLL